MRRPTSFAFELIKLDCRSRLRGRGAWVNNVNGGKWDCGHLPCKSVLRELVFRVNESEIMSDRRDKTLADVVSIAEM
jgi:hypothetical protein